MRQRQDRPREHGGHHRRQQPTRSPSPRPVTGPQGVSASMLDMQGLAGNEAVNQALSVQRLDRRGHGSRSSGQGPAAPGRSAGEIRDEAKELGESLPDHGQAQGRVHSEVDMRFSRSWVGDEAEQTLSETSTLLFESMKSVDPGLDGDLEDETKGGNDREVQGMLINDRLVFASNYNASVQSVVRHGQRQLGRAPTLNEILRFQRGDGTEAAGLRRHEAENRRDKLASLRRKNFAIATEQRGEGEQGRGADATALALRAKTGQPVIVVDAEDKNLRELLTSEEHQGRVFLLTFGARRGILGRPAPDKSLHAEQKLLLALRHAGIRPKKDISGPLAIMGKYRPCMGCAAALMYFRERSGFGGLSFDANNGHYFAGAVQSVYDHLKHIMDEHYLEYIRQMVVDRVASTPGMLHETAPPGYGRTLRVPSRFAARQGDVTPADSDAEFDEQQNYKRVIRTPRSVWSQETARLGIGYAHGDSPSLTAEQKNELNVLWNGSADTRPTNESRQRAIEVADYYKNQGVQVKDLAKSIGKRPDGFSKDLSRYEREGHWKHVPSRSSKVENVSHEKDTSGRHFTKGGVIDKTEKDLIKALIRSMPNNRWCAQWDDLHRHPLKDGRLRAVEAPPELLDLLLSLREEGFDVPSMARYLHIGDRPKDVQSLRRKLDGMAKKKGKASATSVETEDVEMGEAPYYPASSAGDTQMAGVSYTPTYTDTAEAGPSSATPATSEFPGYSREYNAATGQYYYVDQRTGGYHVNINGRLVAVNMSQQYDITTSDW